MKPIEKTANDLFQTLRTRFSPLTVGDENAEITVDPSAARFFSFMYVENEEELGPVSISIVNNRSLKVYYSNDMVENMQNTNEWYALLKELRYFAKQNLLSFDARNIQKDQLDTRDFNFLKVNDGPYQESDVEITESAMFGSKRKSMQRFENATLIVNHKKSVDEAVRGSRSRYIESIFIENNGERFRFPVNYLNGARAMAVHVSEGGTPYDAIGQHIISTVTEMQNLAKFARMTKRHAMEDTDAAGIRDSVVEVYHNIKKDIMRMQNVNNYRSFAETFAPTEASGEADVTTLQEKFTRKVWNEKMNELLPSVQRALTAQAAQVDEASPSVEKSIKNPNFLLVLKKDDAADAMIRKTKFTRADGLLAYIMSDIASRIIGDDADAVANFASEMSINIGDEGASFGTKITPEYKRDKQLAMLLAKKYLDDLKMMSTDAEYAGKVRKDPKDVYGAKKVRGGGYHEAVDAFESWANNVAESFGNFNKQPVTEGVWAVPNTVEKVKLLRKTLNSPIPAGQAAKILVGLIGDDNLFDLIGEIEDEDPNQDVRATIYGWLRNDFTKMNLVNPLTQDVKKALTQYFGIPSRKFVTNEATTTGTTGTTGTAAVGMPKVGTTNPTVVKALSGGDANKARDIKRISDKLAKGQRLSPQEQPIAGEIAKSVMTTKKSTAAMQALAQDKHTEMNESNDYLDSVIQAHQQEFDQFMATGEIDTTGDLYNEMYEYYANEMNPRQRRNMEAQYDYITGKLRELGAMKNEAWGKEGEDSMFMGAAGTPYPEDDYEEDNPVKDAIIHRLSVRYGMADLLKKYGLDRVEAAIDDVASDYSDADELGSSDISIMTKQVLDALFATKESVVTEKTLSVKADRDFDGDGEIESSEEEYMGSRDRAIKQAKKPQVESDDELVRESLSLLKLYAGL